MLDLKSPRPDGISVVFYKLYFDIVNPVFIS